MGYDLHITRRNHWSDEQDEITLDEWEAFCDADPSLEITGAVEAANSNGSTLTYVSDGLAIWTPPIGRLSRFFGSNPISVPFDFRGGNMVVKNPDIPIIAKMCQIAEGLNARVQGDEGEFYRSDGSHFFTED